MRIFYIFAVLFAAVRLAAAPAPIVDFDFDSLPDKPFSVVPHYTDRAFWEARRDTPLGKRIIARADSLLNKEIKLPPDEYYLDCVRKTGPYAGSRARYAPLFNELGGGFINLALAYALTADAKYLPKLEEYITANCDGLRTWVHPAHDLKLVNFNRTYSSINLSSARRGGFMAQMALVLKGALSPEAEAKIRREVKRQVIDPYDQAVNHGRARETAHWRDVRSNWNAVCHCGVQLALLASDMDPKLRRQLLVDSITRQQRYLQEGFLADGYISEGIDYWEYGFSHYLCSAAALRWATDGKIDLMKVPKARSAARFAERIAVTETLYPPISDSPVGQKFSISFMQLRAWLLDEPCTYHEGDADVRPNEKWSAITLVRMRMPKDIPTAPRPQLPRLTEFPNGGVYIMRPGPKGRVAAVFKGGSNNELHNHNDCGEFIVAIDDVFVAIDPGCPVYTTKNFSKQRYESRINNSFCHNVPSIEGELQTNGPRTEVKVLGKENAPEKFSIVFDLRRPYRNIDGIGKLERTMTYDWSRHGEITVADRFEFSSPRIFESAINTFGTWRKTGNDTLEISDRGKTMKVVINTGGVPFSITETRVLDDIRCKKEVTRIAIKLNEASRSGTIALTMSAM